MMYEINNRRINRGDIWFVEKSMTTDQNDDKPARPAIIVSNDAINATSDRVEIVYMTTQEKRPLPTHAAVMGLRPSTAICENVQTVHVDKLQRYVRRLTERELTDVNRALVQSLDLQDTLPQAETKAETCTDAEGETVQTQADQTTEWRLAAITAERDLYRRLYDDLLEKLTRRS